LQVKKVRRNDMRRLLIICLFSTLLSPVWAIEKGEPYCPAPKAGETNGETFELWEKNWECQSKGLCLSYDGKRCEQPIIWKEKEPKRVKGV